MTHRRTQLLAPFLMVLAGCAPEAVTEQGDSVHGLYELFSVIAAVIFVVVASLIAWSIVRYRAKPGAEELPEQTHTNVKLEILWFAIPTLIVIGLFIASSKVSNEVNEEPPEPAVEISVTGFQWGWRFDYSDGGSIVSLPDEPAEIVLPVGETVTFQLTSEDVIHSFYVPRFLLKKDVNPGQENRIDVTIDEAGTFGGVCAEFCGLLHSKMDFSIKAVSLTDYEAWLSEDSNFEPEGGS